MRFACVGLLVTTTALILPACASTAPGTMRAARNVLTADEIRTANVANAYEAVTLLRPEFLRHRGSFSMSDPAPDIIVYLDYARLGNSETLRFVNVNQVVRIEFISATDATSRFGTGHVSGAILVHTR